MKKKIIYFCAGVLLTSLILIAIQVVATAPNPGHELGDISGDLSEKTLGEKRFVGWAKDMAATYCLDNMGQTRYTNCQAACTGNGFSGCQNYACRGAGCTLCDYGYNCDTTVANHQYCRCYTLNYSSSAVYVY